MLGIIGNRALKANPFRTAPPFWEQVDMLSLEQCPHVRINRKYHLKMTISNNFQLSLFHRGTLHRKRRRLEDYQESQTVNTMADMIGRGRISVEGAAGLARSICKDHDIPHEALKAFASLGAEGAHPGNSERDLHRWLNNLWGFKLQTYTVHIDLHVTGHLKNLSKFPFVEIVQFFPILQSLN